jgi:tetratricopeptide (TPR) repeat protein
LDYRRPSSLLYETENYFASGLELIPANNPQNIFDRGFLSLYANLPGQSEIAMQEVQKSGFNFKRDQYQSSQPSYYLARSSWMRGNKKEAESRLRATLKRSPADPWTLAALYVITNDASLRAKLFDYFDDIDAYVFIGEAALEFDNAEAGINAWTYVLQQIPEYRKARIFLAGALTNANQLDNAEVVYRSALHVSADPAMREKEILTLFLKLSERNPENPERLYMYGYVLRQFGHYQEALVIQQLAAEKSQSPAIKAEIAALQMVLSQLAASD